MSKVLLDSLFLMTLLQCAKWPSDAAPWETMKTKESPQHNILPRSIYVNDDKTNTGAAQSNDPEPPPRFRVDHTNTTLVTSAGQTAYLHCSVQNLGERSVSWIRRSDLKILTIGDILYTQDPRFTPIHEKDSEEWILKITSTQLSDSGEYECQLSYHDDVEKKLKLPVSLKVLDSRAHIQDSSDLHLQRGSRLRLDCSVLEPSAPPAFVYWYRNDHVLNYSPHVLISEHFNEPEDRSSAGVGHNVVSSLQIDRVSGRHSGNYTCAPSNARSDSVMVHVVDDESGPAAMQHGNEACKNQLNQSGWLFGFLMAQRLFF